MQVLADLHIHIGRTLQGKPVKITAARTLTVVNILHEASARKGLNLVGIVDAGSPGVQADLAELCSAQILRPLEGGGLSYRDRLTLIPGMELETTEAGGAAHFIIYGSSLAVMQAVTKSLQPYLTNPELSTQKVRLRIATVWDLLADLAVLLVPAHVFTPFKSVYGACCDSLRDLFRPDQVTRLQAVELGLSADTDLAQAVGELQSVAFLSNSDAHSLPKIGREYNLLDLAAVDFANLRAALSGANGCRIVANYGLDPKLGKYHRTFCEVCAAVADTPPPVQVCPHCGSSSVVKGVLDRICEIAQPAKVKRPSYVHQVPLLFIPGLGPKTLTKLLDCFGTELNILHRVSDADLVRAAGPVLADRIIASREGRLRIKPGGGGIYGKVSKD